jgi:DNA-binding response OmpR family regulator
LRKKIEEEINSPLIRTVRGVGYVIRKEPYENYDQG